MSTTGMVFLMLATSFAISPNEQRAKRSAPAEVKPVVYQGIRYTAPHWVNANGQRIAGGYVEAFDVKTNKKRWRLRVYEIRYDPQLEKDVQDVFITSLAIEKEMLVVVNQRGERYDVDLKSRKVTKR